MIRASLPRWLRRALLEFAIDRIESDMSVVAEGMAQCREKLKSGEEWQKQATTRLRAMRAELALLVPASEMLSDVAERKS